MKKRISILILGVLVGVVVALPLTAMASSWASPSDHGDMTGMESMRGQNQEGQDHQGQGEDRSNAHEQMHQMMGVMMGEGSAARMHEEMPGSEEMMEQCASMMAMMQDMQGMMDGMDGMMENGGSGMDGMMNMMQGRMGR